MEDQQFETIELDLEENNELLFKVNIEGASSPARVRLVCEAEDIGYVFDGHPTEESGVVQFLIPEMSNRLRTEGTCEARVEVLIENRYFIPVKFGINFKKSVKVFAESMQVHNPRKQAEVHVSASPIIVNPRRKKYAAQVSTNGDIQPASIAAPDLPAKGSLRERWDKKQRHEEPKLDHLVSRSLRRRKK